jgi:glycosyltransferase involved in cell wall biosynthesis
MNQKILFLATVDEHIYAFHIPFMKLLRDMGYEVEVAAADVGFKGKIEKEGFKVYNLPFSRNPLAISNLKAGVRLYRIMKENKYIMLHTHTPVASFIGRIIARTIGIPNIVYTAHGFHFHEYRSNLKNFAYYRLEKFAGRFTDVLITINTDDYRVARENNMASLGRIVYIKGVGVDMVKVNPEKLQIEKLAIFKKNNFDDFRGTILISVGRLEYEKHFDHIIKALCIIKNAGKVFKCVIAGDGTLKNYLVSLSKKLGLKKDVFFTGYTKHVISLLGSIDIFVFTSSREGLPVSLMEAMAMEKPVVAYNIRGVRDLVVNGKTGFLVPFGNVEALAEKIIYLMEHPDIAKEMGKMGREILEKEFSLKIILKEMEKLYKELLGVK